MRSGARRLGERTSAARERDAYQEGEGHTRQCLANLNAELVA
jgi:hypothetical protein